MNHMKRRFARRRSSLMLVSLAIVVVNGERVRVPAHYAQRHIVDAHRSSSSNRSTGAAPRRRRLADGEEVMMMTTTA